MRKTGERGRTSWASRQRWPTAALALALLVMGFCPGIVAADENMTSTSTYGDVVRLDPDDTDTLEYIQPIEYTRRRAEYAEMIAEEMTEFDGEIVEMRSSGGGGGGHAIEYDAHCVNFGESSAWNGTLVYSFPSSNKYDAALYMLGFDMASLNQDTLQKLFGGSGYTNFKSFANSIWITSDVASSYANLYLQSRDNARKSRLTNAITVYGANLIWMYCGATSLYEAARQDVADARDDDTEDPSTGDGTEEYETYTLIPVEKWAPTQTNYAGFAIPTTYYQQLVDYAGEHDQEILAQAKVEGGSYARVFTANREDVALHVDYQNRQYVTQWLNNFICWLVDTTTLGELTYDGKTYLKFVNPRSIRQSVGKVVDGTYPLQYSSWLGDGGEVVQPDYPDPSNPTWVDITLNEGDSTTVNNYTYDPTTNNTTYNYDETNNTYNYNTTNNYNWGQDPIAPVTQDVKDYTDILLAILHAVQQVDNDIRALENDVRQLGSTIANAIQDAANNLGLNMATNIHSLSTDIESYLNNLGEGIADMLTDLTVNIDAIWEHWFNDVLRGWLEEIINAMPQSMQFVNDNDQSLDTIENLLRRILMRMGGDSSKPDKGTGDGIGFWDWLMQLFEEALQDIAETIGNSTGQMVGLLESLTRLFPFSIPWDIYTMLALFSADPVTPVFDVVFPVPAIIDESEHIDFEVDMTPYDDVAQLLRSIQLIFFCWWLARQVPGWLNEFKIGGTTDD